MKASSFARRKDYTSYLLRVWQVVSDGKRTWRASLESVHTGERQGFASPQLLVEFLQELANNENELALQSKSTVKSN